MSQADDRRVLFYNPANYVVDVIGEGKTATVGAPNMRTSPHWPGLGNADFDLIGQGSADLGALDTTSSLESENWRQLTDAEVAQLKNHAEWHEAQLRAASRAVTDASGALRYVWKTWQLSGRAYGERIVGQTHTFYVSSQRSDGLSGDEGPADESLGRPRMLGDAASDAQDAAAVTMNNALNAHGYKQVDMGIYKAFQSAVGLTPDGYPGPKTMQELKDVLFALGVEMANVPIYPWSASGGYDGVNAPLASSWAPGSATTPQAPPTPQPAPPTGGSMTLPTTTVTGNAPKSNAAVLLIGGTAAAVAGGLGYWYWKKHKRGR